MVKKKVEELLDAISGFIGEATSPKIDGVCAWCETAEPNHTTDCPYAIAKNKLILMQHEISKKYNFGGYKNHV